MKLNTWHVLILVGLSVNPLASAAVPVDKVGVAPSYRVASAERGQGEIQPLASEPVGSSALSVPTFEVAQLATRQQAEASYRAGNYKQARALWLASLEELTDQPGSEARIGQLCYNLGNTAYRDGEAMQAIAWYTAARRHLPRNADLLANLEFVRGELALPPEHSSGILSTLAASLRSWTPAESKGIALLGVLVLAATLLYEALRGGSRGRTLLLAGMGLCSLLWLPFLRHTLAGESSPQMIIAARGTNARSEPRPDSKTLLHLDPTAIVDYLDTWQDWTKIRTQAGEEVWVTSSKVMSIDW
jgi:tetratricopeptide (TPR) repeat protein